MLLQDQVVVVTGSSRGIGRAIALRLAQEGASVVVNGLDQSRVTSVVNEIQEKGGLAVGVCESVQTMTGGERIVATALRKFGKLDILINNAGNIRDSLAETMSEDDWDEVILTHLKGAFACTKPAILHMKTRQQGCIINMTSTSGIHGTVGQLNYSAAKAGILGMTWTLAKELAKYQIRVNAVSPAAFTDMTAPYVEKARKKAEQQGQELPEYWRIGSPEDVAQLVLALVLPESKAISGQVFSVNGGHIGIWHQPQHQTIIHQAETQRPSLTPQAIASQLRCALKH